MTLEEAHKIQRRELMSLRAENKRLKKQLSDDFPIEEKESLLRRIRHLEQIVNTNARKQLEDRYTAKCMTDTAVG